ncbi:MAG: NADH-quinone oxidoreductase subunit A [Dehalococcoidia bacterium]|nr:NADH-quinone oxidoreductase subunit A [Dehalococcoidia bacterium]MQG15809.1 NADH-quinone oxidoreductase subunit A [SAR202 cluster bacterium]|tara:strand:- start:23999 stop:24394 length:396 start_codon:yes stop_codon:yes gene_type:complete
MLDDYFRHYGLITIFALIAVAIPVGMLLVSTSLSIIGIRPNKPDVVKKSIYECGFETLSKRWSGFNSRFYAIALVFVVFDVEVVFLFPWASEFGYMSSKFGAFVLIEMVVFVAILVVGWLYAYRKGDLEWT